MFWRNEILDYYAYVAALERMGFQKKRDFYNDRHWLEATLYKRGDVEVDISSRDEKANQVDDAQRGRACLKSIGVGVSTEE